MRFAFLLSIPFYYNTSNNNLFAANICLCLITVKIVFMALWGTAGFSIVLASLFTRWWTGTTCSKSWIQRGGVTLPQPWWSTHTYFCCRLYFWASPAMTGPMCWTDHGTPQNRSFSSQPRETAAPKTRPGGFQVRSIRSLPTLVVSCDASTKAVIPCRSFGARYHSRDGALKHLFAAGWLFENFSLL